MRRGPVRQVWQKVQLLWDVVRDPDVAPAAKGLAIAALIYLISPLDMIPDPIPVAGLTDDVSVILATVTKLANDLRLEQARRALVRRRVAGIGGAVLVAAIVATLVIWIWIL